MSYLPVDPKNNAHLLVGEKVVCIKDVEFSNGEKHHTGVVYTVEPENKAYFSLFTQTGVGQQNHTYYIKLWKV